MLTTGLVPIAKMSEPLRVPCSQNRQTAATIAQRMMLAEMVRTCVEPSQSSEGLVTEIGAPAGNENEEPLQDRRHGQGHDQRREAQIADAEPVHCADSGSDDERERDGAEARGVGVERHQRQDDGGDCDDRADRKVDTAADHSNGLADADEADHRGEFDDIAQMRVGAETSDEKRGCDPEDRDNRIGDQRAA